MRASGVVEMKRELEDTFSRGATMKTKVLLVLSASLTASLTFSGSAFAQMKSGSSSSNTNAPANPTAGPAASADIGKFSSWDSLMKQGKAGNYLGGTVSVTGAELPWDPIA